MTTTIQKHEPRTESKLDFGNSDTRYYVPLQIRRGCNFLNVEAELLDWHMAIGMRDEPSEADVADDAYILGTDQTILLTRDERLEAESKAICGIRNIGRHK